MHLILQMLHSSQTSAAWIRNTFTQKRNVTPHTNLLHQLLYQLQNYTTHQTLFGKCILTLSTNRSVLLQLAATEPHVGTREPKRAVLQLCHASYISGPPGRWICNTVVCRQHLKAVERAKRRETKEADRWTGQRKFSCKRERERNKGNVKVRRGRECKEPNSTIIATNPKNNFSACFIHSFKKRSCWAPFFNLLSLFSAPLVYQTRPRSPSWAPPPECSSLPNTANIPQTQTDPANQCVCVRVCV